MSGSFADFLKAARRQRGVGWRQPYVIAEVGVNHEGLLDRALGMVAGAAAAGASAVKFQTYKAEKLAARNSPAYWDLSKEPTRSQFALFQKYDSFGEAEYQVLARACDDQRVEFMSTPFDIEAVEMLQPLVRTLKVASADVTNLELLEAVGATGLPVILSTGAATREEVERAVAVLDRAGARSVTLLHCVLRYPTPAKLAQLGLIQQLYEEFPGRLIGYSDHTVPDGRMDILVTAWLLGAEVIEKHYTDDKTAPGNDHYHAMDDEDLRRFRARVSELLALLGPGTGRLLEEEQSARRHARRSLVTRRPLKRGHVIGLEDLVPKRPGAGISPAERDRVLGARVRKDLPEDHILVWGDLDPS